MGNLAEQNYIRDLRLSDKGDLNSYSNSLVVPAIARVGNLELFKINNLPKNFNGNDFSEVSSELQKAMAMTYDAYIEEKGYIPKNQLLDEQNRSKMMWNEFDYLESTIQVVGKLEGKIVCRFRLSDTTCPLSEHFNMKRYERSGPVREVSRLIIDKEYRRHPEVFKNLVAYQFHVSKKIGQLFWTGLEDSTPIYNKLGADTIAHYWYHDFPNHPIMATFQKWDLKKLESEVLKGNSSRFVKNIVETQMEVILH